jgi:arginyl-tRNA synthetase
MTFPKSETFTNILKLHTQSILLEQFDTNLTLQAIQVVETKPEFIGDYSVVIFGIAKQLKENPETLATKLGEALVEKYPTFYENFAVIKGFVNMLFTADLLLKFINSTQTLQAPNSEPTAKIMVEYSSPNTNKPLHFGHMRNIFLGASVSNILQHTGNEVIKANLLNDRGIHICKSMYSWMQDGEKATPENTGKKGDHLVGDFYVQFENEMKADAQTLLEKILQNDLTAVEEKQKDTTKKLLEALAATSDNADKQKDIKSKLLEIAKYNTASMKGTRKLLLDWENNDAKTVEIWKKLNAWVTQGFTNTYNKMGIRFDKYYYESETYLLGKDLVEKAAAKNILYKKQDNSIWIDLTAEGHDEKLLLRGDGTSVYMTQDIGTSKLKYDDYHMDKSIFVIADEQNYHMQVLQKTLAKMQEPCAAGIHHLSYGLVELPNGRMKTREGNVVDADDMVNEMISIAQKHTQELGKVDGFTEEELIELYSTIGLGALKFYLLRVDPKKKMIFNPEESIDFHGFTGPFVQYTYARISSILRKEQSTFAPLSNQEDLLPLERKLVLLLEQYQNSILLASNTLDPSVVCNYVFSVAKTFNGFIAEHKILTAETPAKKQLRLNLCFITKQVIASCLNLLGIHAPAKM